MKELGAEVGGGLIIHHGLIIRTLRYNYCVMPSLHVHIKGVDTIWCCVFLYVLLWNSYVAVRT